MASYKLTRTKIAGFTLLEVLLALAIVSIGFAALFRATLTTVTQTRHLKEKTVKHWVAMQAIAMVQLNLVEFSSPLPITEKMRYLNQNWYWRATLKPTSIRYIDRIDVAVSSKEVGPFTDALTAYRYQRHD